MSGFDNEVVYGKNADYTSVNNQNVLESNGLVTDGKLWIGSTALNVGGTHINVGSITSPGATLTVGYSTPNITLDINGSVVGETITGDVGGALSPTAGNWNIFGQKSNSAQVMMTSKIVSDFYIENRNWETAYVVDPSTTVGTRGTYTTIQAAITAAVADGAAGLVNVGLVYIRQGTYAENLTIPNNVRIHLKGQSPESQFGNTQIITQIVGTITLGNSSTFLVLENISQNQSGSSSIILASGSECNATNCRLNEVSGDGTMIATDCSFATMSGLGASYLVDCEMSNGAGGDWILPGTHHFTNCYARLVGGDGTVGLDFTTGSAKIRNCVGFNIYGVTTEIISIEETTVIAAVTLPNADTRISGLTIDNSIASIPTQLITTTPTRLRGQQCGNVMIRRAVTGDGNVTNNDQYLGCNKAGALAISLVVTDFIKGQVLTFKDESGAAGANNITITPTAGTIDGGATYVIATNYQAINLIFDGTNFFVF